MKKATVINASILAAKSDLASLKAEVDKVYIEKLKTVSAESSDLRNVVDSDVVEKTAYQQLVTKVKTIDASGAVLKTQYDNIKSI